MRKQTREKISELINVPTEELTAYIKKMSSSELGNMISLMKMKADEVENDKNRIYQNLGKNNEEFKKTQNLFLRIQSIRLELYGENKQRKGVKIKQKQEKIAILEYTAIPQY